MDADTIQFDFETTFDPDLYLHFTGRLLNDELNAIETAFLIKHLRLKGDGDRVLDLACGHGRHSNRLATQGMQMVGVDQSEAFLAMARQEATQLGVSVDYRCCDMRHIEFENELDGAFMAFNAFGYFSDAENAEVLRRIVRGLRRGARFCMDLNNRDYIVKHMEPLFLSEIDQDMMISRLAFDTVAGRLNIHHTYFKDGHRREGQSSQRMYSYSEIHALFFSMGLEIRKRFGAYDETPLSLDTQYMVLVAEKI